MPDFLADKRAEIEKRLNELRPLHDEYLRLERVFKALRNLARPGGRTTGASRSRGSTTPRTRARGTSRTRSRATTSRTRSTRGGTRADQALELVRQNPGITVPEIGERLGFEQKNYLYRVMHGLEAKRAVRKQGRGYVAR